MNLPARMVSVLTSVGLLSGGFLATVGLLTKERIALNKQREIERAIVTVVPGTVQSQKIYEEKKLAVYEGENEEGALSGYAVYASGIGFQDKITLMFGVNPSLTKVNRLSILEQLETPGLGAKIANEAVFLQFWEEKDATQPLTLRKPPAQRPEDLGPSEVNTITGATISSESVLQIVNLSLDRLKTLRGEGKFRSENKNAE